MTDLFYVNVADPAGVRRTILEASKTVILSMRRFEELNQLKEKRQALSMEFFRVMREIRLLSMRMRKPLPNVGLRAKAQPAQPKERLKSIKESHTGLEALEQELAELEGKMNIPVNN